MTVTAGSALRSLDPHALIRTLELSPHPEGGYFREIHRSTEMLKTARGPRSALTTIYYLLVRGQRSVFHRVASDEVWHHYAGAPLTLISVPPSLQRVTEYRLGSPRRGSTQVVVIPRRHWQAAEPRGDFTLVGCTVGPGFDFADFTLLRDAPRSLARFRKQHPELARFFDSRTASA